MVHFLRAAAYLCRQIRQRCCAAATIELESDTLLAAWTAAAVEGYFEILVSLKLHASEMSPNHPGGEDQLVVRPRPSIQPWPGASDPSGLTLHHDL